MVIIGVLIYHFLPLKSSDLADIYNLLQFQRVIRSLEQMAILGHILLILEDLDVSVGKDTKNIRVDGREFYMLILLKFVHFSNVIINQKIYGNLFT